ncbi:hypothetical protein NL676_016662 [Syzygium grande]|nr:hypothetical protein NL676_016662 [Syzygium grande]
MTYRRGRLDKKKLSYTDCVASATAHRGLLELLDVCFQLSNQSSRWILSAFEFPHPHRVVVVLSSAREFFRHPPKIFRPPRVWPRFLSPPCPGGGPWSSPEGFRRAAGISPGELREPRSDRGRAVLWVARKDVAGRRWLAAGDGHGEEAELRLDSGASRGNAAMAGRKARCARRSSSWEKRRKNSLL